MIFLASGGETAHRTAEGFTERAGVEIDTSVGFEEFRHAAAGFTHHAGRVALVDHHEGVVLLGKIADFVERGYITVHREHAVGHHNAETLFLCGLQLALEILHIGIGIAITLGFAEAYAVDDRGVVERIADDGIFGREQRFENTAVGIEASGIEDGIVRFEEARDGCFEFLVEVLGAADEAHRRHAVATCVHGRLGCADQARVVGKTEVVVGAEVEHRFSAHIDFRLLRAADETFVLVQTGFANGGQLRLEVLLEFTVHRLG